MEQLIRRLRYWLQRRRIEADLKEELDFHHDMKRGELESDGRSRADAALAARRAMGNVTLAREDARAVWIVPWVESLWQDLRYSARTLRKHRRLTFAAVATVALGVGANTAMFTVVNAILLRPLPYPQPDTIVRLFETNRDGDPLPISAPNLIDWRRENRSFERVAAFQGTQFDLEGVRGVERISGLHVSADFFAVLGVSAAHGRTFFPSDDTVAAEPVVVVSHALWMTRYGGAPDVLGRTLRLASHTFTIVGVLPAAFEFLSPDIAVWTPIRLGGDPRHMRRTERFLQALARLRPGVAVDAARTEMNELATRLARRYPDANTNAGIRVVPLQEDLVGSLREPFMLLLGAVGLVLLVACANVGSLLLAHASGREREIAIRAALGGGRSRLIRQLLTESVVLAALGGIFGLLLARWGVSAFTALWQESGASSPIALSLLERNGFDARAFALTLAVSLTTGLLFGLAPAWQAFRLDVTGSLKGTRAGSGGGPVLLHLRRLFVVSQFAVALVLLIGATLMIRTLWRLAEVDPGFASEHVALITLAAPQRKANDSSDELERARRFYRDVVESVRTLPGVQAAGLINSAPLMGDGATTRFTIDGRPPASAADVPTAPYSVVDPGYFRAMGIPLLRGRFFSDADRADSDAALIVNNMFAARFWPNANPLGRRIRRGGLDGFGPWYTIVGVVGDARAFGLDRPPSPQMYIPHAQFPWSEMTLVVRSAESLTTLLPTVRARLQSVDERVSFVGSATTQQLLSKSVAGRRFNMQLLATFAAIALLLTAVGSYGVMASFVALRQHEIGVRLAMGAQSADVLRLVLGQGMALAAYGIAIGAAASVALTRLMAGLLFGVSPTDPATFVAMAAALGVVALTASCLPAIRATRVDPLITLRAE